MLGLKSLVLVSHRLILRLPVFAHLQERLGHQDKDSLFGSSVLPRVILKTSLFYSCHLAIT